MSDRNSSPDLILRGGRVTTLDRANPLAAAVAISNGKFVAVGSDKDVMNLAGPGMQTIELKGRRVPVLFALATGLRQANVIKLEWSQVDLDRHIAWIHADQAKGRKDIHVCLNSVAISVLQGQVGKHRSRVFTFRGKPINQANTKAWKGALKRAEIENFRWHDLRHTWASWLAQHGTPLNVVQEMGAWESEGMVRRYAHLAPAQLAQHAEIVSNLLDGTVAAQPPKEKGLAVN